MNIPNWQSAIHGKATDSKLVPGCWVESKRFGRCVLTIIEVEWFVIRYKATHLATAEPLWIRSTDDSLVYISGADDESRAALASEGAFGIGEGRSDPRRS